MQSNDNSALIAARVKYAIRTVREWTSLMLKGKIYQCCARRKSGDVCTATRYAGNVRQPIFYACALLEAWGKLAPLCGEKLSERMTIVELKPEAIVVSHVNLRPRKTIAKYTAMEEGPIPTEW